MHIKKGSIYLVLDSTPISDENILGRSDSRTTSLGRGVSFLIAPVVPLKSYWKNWEDRATAFVFQIVRKSICKPKKSASNVCDYIACLELNGSIHDTIHGKVPLSILSACHSSWNWKIWIYVPISWGKLLPLLILSSLYRTNLSMWIERNQLLRNLYPTQGRILGSGVYETISQMSATVSMDLDNRANSIGM